MPVKQNIQNNYYALPEEKKQELARLIAADTLPVVDAAFVPFPVPDTFYTRYGKRILDILISALALVISAPVNLVIMVVTYFDVGRPILFKQLRMGKNNKLFTLVKFRNMTNETDENGTLLPAAQRVTKWGRFVRRTSLDELLNFWSVLKGDMSLIGPRPMPVDYYGRFSKRHDMRHWVRPGLDCPLHGNMVDDRTWDTKFDNDVWYVQNIGFMTDVKLLLGLFIEVFASPKRKINAGGVGAAGGDFMGYFKDGRVMTSDEIPAEYYEKLSLTN